MDDRIRMDLLLLEEIAAELSRLSGRIDRLGSELRSVRYGMPRDAETLVQLEIMREHARIAEATDRAQGLAKRILRAMAAFERCEMSLLHRAQELDTGEMQPDFSMRRREN